MHGMGRTVRCVSRTAAWLIMFAGLSHSGPARAADGASYLAPDGKPVLEVAADPAKGFRFPYLLYIPDTARLHPFPYLIVEMNNTPDVSSNISDLAKDRSAAVRGLTAFSFGNGVAERLGAPFLIPIFPRPKKPDGEDVYTFALSREAFLVSDEPLVRIDLQLVAMIADAKQRLAARGETLQPKIMMAGFSASAMFASRFVFLHPELVKAAAFGAVNAFFMLPLAELSGRALDYPLGIADYQKITGHPFDTAAYRTIPEFAFMGTNDSNDAVVADGGDAYSAGEAAIILKLFGRQMMPDRWLALEKAYATANPNVSFHTYQDIGHGLDVEVSDDAAEFLRNSR